MSKIILSPMKSILLTVALFLFLIRCSQQSDKLIRITGKAQGTSYNIIYLSKNNLHYQMEIDSLLRRIDLSLSTYIPFSIISRINKNDSNVKVDVYFKEVFNKSVEVSEKTEGLFDVTVGPVINAYGFGFTKKANVDSSMIDSLLSFVGYKMVKINGDKLVKQKAGSMIDFNGIAQGYAVDVLASYLESKGIQRYLVELGGEVKAKGKKNKKEYWRVGIDQPNEMPTHGRPLHAVINLNNSALATSGNYRRFYVENGKRYAHIIDPLTGYPAKHNLLSATVIASDCMTADAYATAFMVMGLEKSKQFLFEKKELGLEVYFIYDENGIWKTYTSETLKEWVTVLP